MSESLDPEDAAKVRVSEWVEDHGADVYWEKRNGAGYQTFHINDETDSAQKPDLVVDFGDRVFAVEMKHGNEKSVVYNALLQNQRYFMRYLTHEQTYICGATAMDIDGFLTGTRHSLEGRLFPAEYEVQLTREDFSDGRIRAIQNEQLPQTEYAMTEQHVRTLWRVKDKTEGEESTRNPGVGALLSTALHPNWNRKPVPAVLWKKGKQQRWDVFNGGGRS